MYLRLLEFLRCPTCHAELTCIALETQSQEDGGEIISGLLHCAAGHWFPIVRGIPRMLPDAIPEHWPTIQNLIPQPVPASLTGLIASVNSQQTASYHRATRENFSHEWDHHELGGKTWGMELSDRVQWFFVDPLHIQKDDLAGKLMLDAGCGNGSQSVAYTTLGLEVIAVDLSSGLEKGYAFRQLLSGAKPERVHFVQADLQHPPLAANILDIIHSAGVLHHTPDTLTTFRALASAVATRRHVLRVALQIRKVSNAARKFDSSGFHQDSPRDFRTHRQSHGFAIHRLLQNCRCAGNSRLFKHEPARGRARSDGHLWCAIRLLSFL